MQDLSQALARHIIALFFAVTSVASGVTSFAVDGARLPLLDTFRLPKITENSIHFDGAISRNISVAGTALSVHGFDSFRQTVMSFMEDDTSVQPFTKQALGDAVPHVSPVFPRLVKATLLPFKDYARTVTRTQQASAETGPTSASPRGVPFLDQVSLTLYCKLATLSTSLDTKRCDYATLVSDQFARTFSTVAFGDTPQTAQPTTLPSSGGLVALNDSLTAKASSTPIYITQYITQYVPVLGPAGPAGVPGTPGQDGRDGADSNHSQGGFGGYVSPTNVYLAPTPSQSLVGVSTIGYLNAATIDYSQFNYGTSTNMYLTNATVNSSVFTGFNLFNDTALFTGNVTINNLTATSSSLASASVTDATVTNSTTTNAYATSFTSATSSTVYASTTRALTVNATTTNEFVTNFFATNATTTDFTATNASTTNSTTTNGFFTNLIATLASFTGFTATNSTTTNAIAINASTTNATTTNGFLSNLIATLATFGNTTINGTLTVSGTSTLATTTATSLTASTATTTGNQFVGGSLTVVGTTTTGSVVLGTSTSNTIEFTGLVNSNIIPAANITYDIGSPSFYWRHLYVDSINVNSLSAASSSIGGTNNSDFSINADNGTSDGEDSSIIFFRGVTTPNALFRWDSTTKRLESNMSFSVMNETPTTGTTTLSVQSGAGQGSTNLFELLNNAGSKLSVFDANGWLGIGTSTPTSALTVVGTSTLATTTIASLSVTGTSGTTTIANNLSITGDLNFNGGFYQNGAPFAGSQWTTSGQSIYYTGGAVGIGTTSSSTTLFVQGAGSVSPLTIASSTGTTLFSIDTTGKASLQNASTTNLTVNGTAYHIGDILPTTDISRSLGSNALRFLNLFSQNIFASSSVITNASTTNITVAGLFNVQGTSALASTTVTLFTASGNTSLQNASATALTVSGQAVLGAASTTVLTAPVLYYTSATGTTISNSGYLNASGTLAVTGASTFYGTSNHAADILPTTDISRSIGSNALRFLNLFSQNVFASSSVITSGTSTNFFITNASTTNVAVSGYLNASGTLAVTGQSTFAGNVFIGTTTPTYDTSKLTVQGTTTLIGTSIAPTALRAIGNIDNTATSTFVPKVLSSISTGSSPRSAFIYENYLYVVNRVSSTLSIIDVSNPLVPSTVSTINTGNSPESVYVSGRYAYVANYNSSSLSIIDVSNPASPVTVATPSVGTNPHSVYVSGRYAYVANYNSSSLSIIDVSNPASPVTVATPSVGTNPQAVFVSGRYAYVANYGSSTLSIVDITNPAAPVTVSAPSTGTNPLSVYVSGRYAYVANYNSSSLSIIDVSNPASPVTVATPSTGTGPHGVYVSGRYAYVANVMGFSSGSLSVIDVSSSTAPVTVATPVLGTAAWAVSISGRYGYVANRDSNSVSIIDLGGLETTSAIIHSLDAGNLSVRNDITSNGSIFANTSLSVGAGGFQSQGAGSVYGNFTIGTSSYPLFNANSGLNRIGIGTSTGLATLFIQGTSTDNPFIVASSTGTSLFTILANGNVGVGSSSPNYGFVVDNATSSFKDITPATTDVYVLGTNAKRFLSLFSQNIFASSTLGVTSTTTLYGNTILGTPTISTNPSRLTVQGTTTLVGSATSPTSLRAIGNIDNTLSSTFTPIIASSTATDQSPDGVFVSGNYAYVVALTTGTLGIFDVSDPRAPVSISSLSLSSPTSVYVSGRYAYVTRSSVNILSIVDISNSASPTLISSLTLSGTGAQKVHVSGRYAYVVGTGGTMSIVDVTNAASPVTVSTVAAGSYGIFVSGRYAYATNNGSNTLSIIDVSNPAAPTIASSTATGSSPTEVYVSGRYAYVTNQGASDSISIINVSNPAIPVTVATLSAGVNNPQGIFVSGRYAYVGGNNGNAFTIYDVASSTAPSLVSSVSGGQPYAVYVSGRYAYFTNYSSNTLSIVDVGGIETSSAIIHSLDAGNLSVRNDITSNGSIFANTSLSVGAGGFQSQGAGSVYGNFTIGTSSYPLFNANSGLNRIGIGTSTGLATLFIQGTSTDNPFIVASSTGTSLFTILANGNVGVGSSSPNYGFVVDNATSSFKDITPATTDVYVLGTNAKRFLSLFSQNVFASSSVITNATGTTLALGGYLNASSTLGVTGVSNFYSALNALGAVNASSTLMVTATSSFIGRVNVGTTTSSGMLTLQSTGGINLFNFASSSGASLLMLNQTGALLLGTSTYSGLAGEIYANFLTTASTTATTTIAGNLNVGSGGIIYDASSTVTSISNLELGNMTFDTNAGIVSWTDLPVTSAAATGTIESYTAQINGTGILTVYSESTGAGAIRYPRIGIGTSTPLAVLEAYTSTSTSNVDLFRLDSDVGSTGNVKFRVDSDGDIFTDGGTTVGSPADLAENYTALEALDAGTVVAFGTTTEDWDQIRDATSTIDTYAISGIRKAFDAYEAVGVVSTKAGITLGGNTTNGVPVAFVGRVPVKITTENGEIKRGDYLTVSRTVPGYAMKLTGEGRALGRALSDYSLGRDKVMMLVEHGYQRLDLTGKTATTTGMLTTGNVDLNANGVAITNIKSIASANGTWSIDENGRIVAKVLCLEDVCIDRTQLSQILNATGQSGIVSSQQSTDNSNANTGTGIPVGEVLGDATSTDPLVETSTSTSETSGSATSTDSILEVVPSPDETPLPETVEPTPEIVEPTDLVVVPTD